MRSSEQQALFDRLGQHYRYALTPVMIEIERTACGCDYGGTSWTTRREADRLAKLLELGPRRRLLDVGAGSGWPGLYLARVTGCDVTLVDIPADGLRLAAERAIADELAGACWTIVGDGAMLPFRDGTFDAIGHSDVLCCLEAKLAVLEACRSVIRTRGRMAFTVISIAPNLSRAQYTRAMGAGPPFKETGDAYVEMLQQSGWCMIERVDLTTEYAATARRMLREEEDRADQLTVLLGAGEFSERIARRRAAVRAVGDGLLCRELFTAIAMD